MFNIYSLKFLQYFNNFNSILGETMKFKKYLKVYFKKDVSCFLFLGVIAVFLLTSVLKISYSSFCDLSPFFINTIPDIETCLGMLMSMLFLGVVVTEYLLK